MTLKRTAQSPKRTKSHSYENCVTKEIEERKLTAKQALKKVKDFEKQHKYIHVQKDPKTIVLKRID